LHPSVVNRINHNSHSFKHIKIPYHFIMATTVVITIVITIITAHIFANSTKNPIPIIHDSNNNPIAITAEQKTIFPGIESRQTAITATIIIAQIIFISPTVYGTIIQIETDTWVS